MGHLNIVTDKTIKKIFEEGHISITGNLGTLYIKTISDIFSDALAVREDDLVFPWLTGNGAGFQHCLKISGKPFYVPNDKYPLKVPLKSSGEKFDFLTEAEAVNLWRDKLLWNLIGKKSLQRGRALTHQTPQEDQQLLKLLKEKTENSASEKIILEKKSYENSIPITIDTSQNENEIDHITELPKSERISKLDLSKIGWVTKSGKFSTEKTLEAWLTENIDKDACENLRNIIFDNNNGEIEWFGNYLPFGVQGGNMDFVIIQKFNGKTVAYVIELKVGGLSNGGYLEAVNQVNAYAKHIEGALTAYGIENLMVKKIILTYEHNPRGKINDDYDDLPDWIMYNINQDGKVVFKKFDPTR